MRPRHSPWAPSPHTLRRRGVRFDNIALVPASLLPFKAEWHQLASHLPHGDALLVVPEADGQLRHNMRLIADQLQKRGHRVSAIPSTYFRSDSPV